MNARLLCTAFNQNKLSMLKDLLESTEDRLIIFYQYNLEKAIENVVKELNKPISYINGDLVDKMPMRIKEQHNVSPISKW